MFVFLFTLLLPLPGNSQQSDTSKVTGMRYSVDLERHISILTGYNGWTYGFAELGIAINQYGRIGQHPAAWAFFLSDEIKTDKNIIHGPKIGAWAGGGAGGMALGINLISYMCPDYPALCIRPEIGMGFGRFKVVYGYNLPLTNIHVQGLNASNLGIAYMFGIKKIKTIKQ